jgi:hypothetical protein
MFVTGVQAVGAKGVTAIQGAVVDTKAATRSAVEGDREGDRGAAPRVKAGRPQPVVFPRAGVPLDQRPVSMRRHHAEARYREDGGGDDDAA